MKEAGESPYETIAVPWRTCSLQTCGHFGLDGKFRLFRADDKMFTSGRGDYPMNEQTRSRAASRIISSDFFTIFIGIDDWEPHGKSVWKREREICHTAPFS